MPRVTADRSVVVGGTESTDSSGYLGYLASWEERSWMRKLTSRNCPKARIALEIENGSKRESGPIIRLAASRDPPENRLTGT